MGKSVGQWKRESTRAEREMKSSAANKKPQQRRSFVAKYPATCGTCHGKIAVGQRARYNPSGVLVHHRHRS